VAESRIGRDKAIGKVASVAMDRRMANVFVFILISSLKKY
jgi:hypothetical protein